MGTRVLPGCIYIYIYRGKASEVTEEENKWKKERGGWEFITRKRKTDGEEEKDTTRPLQQQQKKYWEWNMFKSWV